MSVCVLLPSARPDNLQRCLAGLHNVFIAMSVVRHIGFTSYDLLNINDSCHADLTSRSMEQYNQGAIHAWNNLFTEQEKENKHKYYVLAADDLIFHPGWLDHALTALDSIGGSGLVAFNDLHSNGNEYAAHFLVSADFVENELGGLIYPPHYKSWWADREVSDIAKACNKYVYAPLAVVEHLHPSFNAAPTDAVYQLAAQNYAADEQTYRTRKAAGFPKDW